MEIPEHYLQQVVRYLKDHSVFLLGRFTYEDVNFEVKLFKIPSIENNTVFFIRVSYQRLCENIVQFTCNPMRSIDTKDQKNEQLNQIKELFKRFSDWKNCIQQRKIHFLNENFESLEMYQAKLFINEWTSGESNDVCYVCHEPCLYYENRNCSHSIHKLCFVKMIQKDQHVCGICKKSLHYDDEDDDE
jgi:hypothetical protein